METTMTKDLAMTAVREICARPRRSANTAHAGTFGSDQGRTLSFNSTVPFAGSTAPVAGVGYPRLKAPPV